MLGMTFFPPFSSLTLLITENSAELIAHIRVDFIPLLPIILSLSSFCYICVPSNWVRYGICVQRRSNNSSSKSKTHTGNIPGCLILVIDYSIRRLSLTQLQLLGSLSRSLASRWSKNLDIFTFNMRDCYSDNWIEMDWILSIAEALFFFSGWMEWKRMNQWIERTERWLSG